MARTEIRYLDQTPAEIMISVEKGSFGWHKGQEASLRSVDLEVSRSKLVMIIGPVGSGKSLLLKGLLGEVPLLAGSVTLCSAEVGFCDQNPWLFSGTMRQNILGPCAWDETWYATVVRACAIDEDVRTFSERDLY